jgi:hypothetical protein
LLRAGRPREADSLARARLAHTPEDADALLVAGTVALLRDDLEAARELLRRGESLAPGEAAFARALALLAWRRNDLAAARSWIARHQELGDRSRAARIFAVSAPGLLRLLGLEELEGFFRPTVLTGSGGVAAIPLLLDERGIIVRGRAGTGPELELLLDTGGSALLSLFSSAPRRLPGRSFGPFAVFGISGPVHGRGLLLQRLQLGGLLLRDLPAIRIAGELPRPPGAAPLHGVLGLGWLREAVAELDLVGLQLLLTFGERPLPHMPAGPGDEPSLDLPFWNVGLGKIVLEVTVRGSPHLAVLDSGAHADFISRGLARGLGLDMGDDGEKISGIGATAATDAYPLGGPLQFEIAGTSAVLRDPRILPMLDETLSPALGIEIDLLLGRPFILELSRIVIDLRRHRLRAWPAARATAATARPRAACG